MRENPYLIRMDIEEDCNYSTYNATSGIYYRQFNWPVLGAMKDEFDCMQFDNGEAKPVGYHEHSFGTETFMISQGKFLCYCTTISSKSEHSVCLTVHHFVFLLIFR